MSMGRGNISAKKARLMKSEVRCAICGRTGIRNPTVDHVIPLAVLKWNTSKQKASYSLMKGLNHRDNLVIVCKHCNEYKGMELPTAEYINRLVLPQEQKSTLIEFIDTHKDLIDGHNTLKQYIYEKCKGRCQCGCNTRIPLYAAAIMRKDDNKPRDAGNGVIVLQEHCDTFRIKMERKLKHA